ncbi:MAG: L,D-transpeptidase [Chloroflexi bacterium]|jgi:lipoprotein-anchoring transpeptidase ErfK/SrfK|nr:L,D-transpeptidase [Anaerolineaceae bacterium]NMB87005.1 L,D-transpeptidase [Chloroflexota bacterium]
MKTEFSRRDFLKVSALGLASLAFQKNPSPFQYADGDDLARIATRSVSVYSEPNDESQILYQRYRDDLIHVYYEVVSEYGPGYNPVWYRTWRGYIHSAHLQRVKTRLNPVLSTVSEDGVLTEVTVPISQSMRYSKYTGWEPLYRLYYESVHWIVGVDEGPDGGPWYKVEDELDSSYIYFVPAEHLRVVTRSELAPISPDVPPEKKRIEVSIARQMLTAYEGDDIVLQTKISSGVPQPNRVPGRVPTDTPTGTFHIQNKMPSKHMGDGYMTADLEAYELPGVPWVSFFEPVTGVATHGTYWHTNYGMTMSHGCVNMRSEEAKWIFRWATPFYEFGNWDTKGYGTQVIVS